MDNSHEYYKSKYQRSKLLNMILVSVICGIIIGGAFSLGMFADIDVIKPGTANASENVQPVINNTQSEIENIPEYESPVVSVAEKVLPSIVMIKSKVTIDSSFGYRFGSGGQSVNEGTGSGIIYNEDGYIITNQHVIDGASEIEVVLYDGKEYKARVLGQDSKSDLAVLKIEAEGLIAADFGDSDSIRVGELAVAIGTPAGQEFSGSVTAGIISALNRTIDMGEKELELIQTDAAINPGNSGGALVNKNGEVIGINSVKLSAPDIEGMGFAIPINDAIPLVDELISHGYVKRPWIGVQIGTVTDEIAEQYNVPTGAFISRVYYDSPAEEVGLQVDDIITEIDGVRIETAEDLITTVGEHEPGDIIELKVHRNDEFMNVDVELGVMKPN